MSDWAPRRFWTEVHVRAEEGGHAVYLDERPVRTPYRSSLLAPTASLAEAVAEEWRSQTETVDPESMPFTRALNSAIDKVAPNRMAVAEMLAAYAETDLLCYRASHPVELVARQAEVWDPYLDWAAATYAAHLKPVVGVMPEDQDPEALAALSGAVAEHSDYGLTALHEVVTLTGSLVLGLAALAGQAEAGEIWQAARLDEVWQGEQWGADEEAEAAAAAKAQAVAQALRFYALAEPVARALGARRFFSLNSKA